MNQVAIIDDELHIVENLKKALDWNGFHLEIGCAETNPQKALDYILSNPVSIVITDIAMPTLHGLDLIQKIKAAKPYVYVIVLSAYDNFEFARTALRYGAENYLLKPVDPEELSDTISQIMGHIQTREQLNSTYGQAILTFRNTFTEQWVKNLLSSSDFSSRADLLGINLNAQSYTSVIFSCTKMSADVMSRFFELFLQYLPGNYTGNFFFASPVCLVSVLSPATENSEAIEPFISRILLAGQSAGINVFASIGPSVSHYTSVHESYQKAVPYLCLEHANLPYFVYHAADDMNEAAENALASYHHSLGKDLSSLLKLYKVWPTLPLSESLLAIRLKQLCHEPYLLPEKFPELCQELAKFSVVPHNIKGYYDYVLSFLHLSDQLLLQHSQSMYPCVDAVLKMVNELTNQEISLKTMAARLNVSPSYLGMVFHKQTGYYFNDYLTEVRLKKAADLLKHTDLKLKEIVEKTGFSSQPYFTRSFKRFYNVSPLHYRREQKLKSIETL
jgi:two-component system response regulator YesN